MQRLGINHGRYHGDSIDVDRTLAACDAAARNQGWEREALGPHEIERDERGGQERLVP